MSSLCDFLPPGSADRELASHLDPARLPAHVAVIMDGNGRWANRRGLPRVAGHRAGVNSVRQVVETSAQLGVQALTLYAFSVENWKRPRYEIDMLWRLLRYYLRRELPELQRNNIRLNAVGRLDELPRTVHNELNATVAATSGNTGMWLNLAINYSGRAEMVDAVNQIVQRARNAGTLASLEITEEMIDRHLYTPSLPDPDLLIRTSGEMRISNFLLWQIAYAELYVTETLWPDFGRTEMLRAILDYQKRERRFGGLKVTSEVPPVQEDAADELFEEIALSS